MRDPFSDAEERWVTMGGDVLGACSLLSYTWRGESVRLIFGTEGDGAGTPEIKECK